MRNRVRCRKRLIVVRLATTRRLAVMPFWLPACAFLPRRMTGETGRRQRQSIASPHDGRACRTTPRIRSDPALRREFSGAANSHAPKSPPTHHKYSTTQTGRLASMGHGVTSFYSARPWPRPFGPACGGSNCRFRRNWSPSRRSVALPRARIPAAQARDLSESEARDRAAKDGDDDIHS